MDEVIKLLSRDASPYPKGAEGQATRHQDYTQLFMGSEQGRRVLNDILHLSCVMQPIPGSKAKGQDGHYDETQIMILNGRRNMALSLIQIIANEPETVSKEANRK